MGSPSPRESWLRAGRAQPVVSRNNLGLNCITAWMVCGAEVVVRDYGLSEDRQDEVWRAEEPFSVIARAVGVPVHHVRASLQDTGKVIFSWDLDPRRSQLWSSGAAVSPLWRHHLKASRPTKSPVPDALPAQPPRTDVAHLDLGSWPEDHGHRAITKHAHDSIRRPIRASALGWWPSGTCDSAFRRSGDSQPRRRY